MWEKKDVDIIRLDITVIVILDLNLKKPTKFAKVGLFLYFLILLIIISVNYKKKKKLKRIRKCLDTRKPGTVLKILDTHKSDVFVKFSLIISLNSSENIRLVLNVV